MKSKIIIKDFVSSLGRAGNELAKSLLWQEIKHAFTSFTRSHSKEGINTTPISQKNCSQSTLETNVANILSHPSTSNQKDAECNEDIKIIEKALFDSEKIHKHDSKLNIDGVSLLIENIDDDNLQGLLQDRVNEIIEKNNNLEQQALVTISFMDEIESFINSYNKNNQVILQEVIKTLQKELTLKNCEIIDSDSWNPELQRAIEIDYCLPDNVYPVIVKKFRTGLKINGRLIRKQEVSIQKEIIN